MKSYSVIKTFKPGTYWRLYVCISIIWENLLLVKFPLTFLSHNYVLLHLFVANIKGKLLNCVNYFQNVVKVKVVIHTIVFWEICMELH